MLRANMLKLGFATILTLGGGTAVASDKHSHDGHAAGEQQLQLDHGKKWATDAPLRKGMDGIRADLAQALPAIHKDRLPAEDYAALAGKVNAHVEYMIANCKLPPAADAQLHLVLAQVLQGAEEMKSGDHRRDGAVRVVEALNAYGKHFDHAGWKGFEH